MYHEAGISKEEIFDRAAELRFSVGLRDSVNGRSDGVTFRVLANGQEVWRLHTTGESWHDARVDLSPYAGTTLRLRLLTGNGPDENPSFDWAVWGDPVVALQGPQTPRDIAYSSTDRAVEVLGAVSPETLSVSVDAAGVMHHRVKAMIPGATVFTHRLPHPVAGPVTLTALPFTVSATVEGRTAPLPMQYVGCSAGEGVSAGQLRAGLTAHPPSQGRTYADFLLHLPVEPLVLRVDAALQDGSRSEGCRFLVERNGEAAADLLLTGPDGWHPMEVDLGAYAGRTILLSLVVDAAGSHYFDWARWGQPRLERKAD